MTSRKTTDVIARRRTGPGAASISAIVVAGKRTIDFAVGSLSATGAHLVGPLTLTQGERIQINFRLDNVDVEVAAEVVGVQSPNLMIDRAIVHFVDMSAGSRALIQALAARVSGTGEGGLEFGLEFDEERVTGQLPRNQRDFDLDTVETIDPIDAATTRLVKKIGT